MREIKRDQEAKLAMMREELEDLNAEIDRGIPNLEEENSKK